MHQSLRHQASVQRSTALGIQCLRSHGRIAEHIACASGLQSQYPPRAASARDAAGHVESIEGSMLVSCRKDALALVWGQVPSSSVPEQQPCIPAHLPDLSALAQPFWLSSSTLNPINHCQQSIQWFDCTYYDCTDAHATCHHATAPAATDTLPSRATRHHNAVGGKGAAEWC
jgi:hypothetical protein